MKEKSQTTVQFPETAVVNLEGKPLGTAPPVKIAVVNYDTTSVAHFKAPDMIGTPTMLGEAFPDAAADADMSIRASRNAYRTWLTKKWGIAAMPVFNPDVADRLPQAICYIAPPVTTPEEAVTTTAEPEVEVEKTTEDVAVDAEETTADDDTTTDTDAIKTDDDDVVRTPPVAQFGNRKNRRR